MKLEKETFGTPAQIKKAFQELLNYIKFLDSLIFSEEVTKRIKIKESHDPRYIIGRPVKVELAKKGNCIFAKVPEAPNITATGENSWDAIRNIEHCMIFQYELYKSRKRNEENLTESAEKNLEFLKGIIFPKEHIEESQK